ncbi:hypothetical protein Taro_008870 [Colocasia esculenta]|uniref:Uncharacterized protein n=1 Tax=Colocasia esculenta TaxID=4460 RepID=A0A843TUX1_COLES|nr:hypothetical protein [Colocasia esculenta]
MTSGKELSWAHPGTSPAAQDTFGAGNQNSANSGSDRPSWLGFGPSDPSRGNLSGPLRSDRSGSAGLGGIAEPGPVRRGSARTGAIRGPTASSELAVF